MSKLLADIGEFQIHSQIREWLKDQPEWVAVGVGDDAAVLEIPADYQILLTTDSPSVSWPMDVEKGRYGARFCVAHNFSDILAMGGRPLALLLSIHLHPEDTTLEFLKTIIETARDEAAYYQASLVGGDIKEHSNNLIGGAAVGIVPRGRSITRIGARPGNIVAITLTRNIKLGARWAQDVIYNDPQLAQQFQEYIKADYKSKYLKLPFHEMLTAAATGHLTSAMDTSDGVLGCLQLLGRANGVAFELEEELLEELVDPAILPIAEALHERPLKFLFNAGHDWECVVTVREEHFEEVRTLVQQTGGDLAPLGKVIVGNEMVQLRRRNGSLQPISFFAGEKFKKVPYKLDQVMVWRSSKILQDM